MAETELVALVPVISEPLSMPAHRMDLESFSTIMDWVFTPVNAPAYDAVARPSVAGRRTRSGGGGRQRIGER